MGNYYTVITKYGEEHCKDINELADTLCDIGINSQINMEVLGMDDEFIFNTTGPFINECANKEFYDEFVKVYTPILLDNFSNTFCDIDPEDALDDGININPDENMLIGVSDWELQEAIEENDDIEL